MFTYFVFTTTCTRHVMSGEWLNVSFCSNGTSMISLIIPQNGQLSIVNKMLTEEMGTAARIKSRVNRQSVQSAISSVQQRLKLYRTGQWYVEIEVKDLYHVKTFLKHSVKNIVENIVLHKCFMDIVLGKWDILEGLICYCFF